VAFVNFLNETGDLLIRELLIVDSAEKCRDQFSIRELANVGRQFARLPRRVEKSFPIRGAFHQADGIGDRAQALGFRGRVAPTVLQGAQV
jgi:hypothetical protein